MTKTKEIDGILHWQNEDGHWVAEGRIDVSVKIANGIVECATESAKKLRIELKNFKREVFTAIDTHLENLEKESGVKRRYRKAGKKGGFTLFNFDRTLKIQVRMAESIGFDERLQTASGLIDQYIDTHSIGVDEGIKRIVRAAFDVDKEGNISAAKIITLKKIKIDHPDWEMAISLINESMRVVESKRYVNLYKINKDGGWDHLPLDLATV